jgi:hypothetical protein
MISFRRPLRRGLPPLGCAALLLLAACSTEGGPTSGERGGPAASAAASDRPQVVVIALDGVEPKLLDALLETGKLPNFQKLIDRGSQATIDAVTASISPVVWTTVATGVSPERHGITDFTVDDVPVTSTMRRVAAFWNLLPRYDLTSAVLGWMVTWPAEPDSGIVVSDRAHWGNFEDKIAPGDVIELGEYHYNGVPDLGILPRFTDYPYDPQFASLPKDDPRHQVSFLIKRRLLDIYVHDTTFSRIAADVLEENRPDVVAVYFQGADYVSHGFWQYFEPGPFREAGWTVPEEDVQLLGAIIPKYYVYLDRLVGDLLGRVDEDALVIVLSDHGFGPGLGKYRVGGDFLSGNHRPSGVLILSGPQIVDGQVQTHRITHYDILPTMLFALGLPIARNLEGQPLLHYFEDSFLAGRPASFVPRFPYGAEPEEEAPGSAQDDEILDELRSLGYID